MRYVGLVNVLLAGTFAFAAPQSHAQAPASKPVRIISPYAAGGTNDVIARIVGQKLAELTGRPFIVENRPGAGGVIGAEVGAKAAPDGNTVTLISASIPINAALRPLPFDPVRDFAPIGMVGVTPYVLLVNPSVPVRTVKELIALARARPGALTFGSGGIGTPGHLAGEMLMSMAHVKMVHVPYKAGSLALPDLLSGNIALTFSTTVTSSELIKAKRVQPLAVTTAARIPAFPEIPTVAESGLAGYDFSLWLGFAAPAGTPLVIVDQLAAALSTVVQMKDTRDALLAQSVEPQSSTPQALAQKMREDVARYAKLIKDSGVRVEY
jgi:tripartite-type tricarboxylate transporter receptor subunit TctC